MRSQVLTRGEETTHVLVFQTGDEVVSTFEAFSREHEITAARFTAIGALSEATLGYFDWERKEYEELPLAEQVEMLTLAGDVALKDGEAPVHAHVVLGKRDATAHGGHLLERGCARRSSSSSSSRPLTCERSTTPRPGWR